MDEPGGSEAEKEDAGYCAGGRSDPMLLFFAERLSDFFCEEVLDFADLGRAVQVPYDVDDESRDQAEALETRDLLIGDHPREDAGHDDENRKVDSDDLA